MPGAGGDVARVESRTICTVCNYRVKVCRKLTAADGAISTFGRSLGVPSTPSGYATDKMQFTRRGFLIGAGSGLSVLALTACTDQSPVPTTTPRPTSVTPSTPRAVPQPAGMSRSAWAADPFSRGSLSFMAVGSTPEHRSDLREPLNNRVFFSGEATSSDHAGTIVGARQSGAQAASAVAAAAGSGEKIAIIGAGLAGSEAAKLLVMYGHEITVIEARDRVGGRIHTINSNNWPTPVELGGWQLNSGRDAAVLSDLATRVHNSAPYRPESQFFSRDLYRTADGAQYREAVSAAIADHTWIAEQRRKR